MKKPEQYIKITLEQRRKAIKNRAVVRLLDALPNHIRTDFLDAFFAGNYTHGVDHIRQYFVSISDIAKEIVRDPGSADIFDYLYHNRDIVNLSSKPLDEYYLSFGSGLQIYRRLQVMQKELPEILWRIVQEFPGERLRIDNIGSGQGLDMIGVLRSHEALRRIVHVRNIDPNQVALDAGWMRIVEYGLEANFESECVNIQSCTSREAHFVILSGFYCPMSFLMSKRIQTRDIPRFLIPGGYCLHNATTKKMLEYDLVTDFSMRILGWFMGYKTQEEITGIATEKDWDVQRVFFDTDEAGKIVGFNQMVLAKKR